MSSRYLNTVSHWYGRFGNNIQQICNGIIYSSINGDGFFSPHHDLIEQIVIGSQKKKLRSDNVDFFTIILPIKILILIQIIFIKI